MKMSKIGLLAVMLSLVLLKPVFAEEVKSPERNGSDKLIHMFINEFFLAQNSHRASYEELIPAEKCIQDALWAASTEKQYPIYRKLDGMTVPLTTANIHPSGGYLSEQEFQTLGSLFTEILTDKLKNECDRYVPEHLR